MATKKATKTVAKTSPNGAEFVRNLPTSMPAKEVVAKAEAAGISMTEGYVYTIRSSAKKSAKSHPSERVPTSAVQPPRGRNEEMALRAIMISLGLTKTQEILDDVKRALGLLS